MIRALLFFFSISILNAQNPEWIIYNTSNSPLLSNSVYALEVDINNNIWIAGEGGLVKFDRTNWETYTPSNSGIPVDRIFVIDSDRDGVLWFMGQLNYNQQLVKYDGTDWTSYTTANSPIPSNFVKAIAVDSNNIKWFFNEINQTAYLTKFDGTTNWYTYPGYFYYAMFGELMDADAYGNIWSVSPYILAKFNDQGYTLFNGFFGQYPSCVKADKNGNIWVACGGAGWGSLVKWDGSGYTSYNHLAYSLETDSNTIWVGTEGIQYLDSSGYLARLDENGWTIFNTFNSPLPVNILIGDIETDHYGNTWMTLYPKNSDGGGVAVYREGGVIIPVELLSFTSFVDQNNVELRWATATELNNRGFAD